MKQLDIHKNKFQINAGYFFNNKLSLSLFCHVVLVRFKRSYICCFLVSLLGG